MNGVNKEDLDKLLEQHQVHKVKNWFFVVCTEVYLLYGDDPHIFGPWLDKCDAESFCDKLNELSSGKLTFVVRETNGYDDYVSYLGEFGL